MAHPTEPVIDYVSRRKSADNERYHNENTPARSLSPPPQPSVPRAPADLNPVDILKPFFQYMASQQQRQQQQQQQQQQQHQPVYEDVPRPASPMTGTTNSFDPTLIEKIVEEKTHPTEIILQPPVVMPPPTPSSSAIAVSATTATCHFDHHHGHQFHLQWTPDAIFQSTEQHHHGLSADIGAADIGAAGSNPTDTRSTTLVESTV